MAILFYRRVDRVSVVIGERIKALLELRGFKSQSALARAAKISQSTLNGLINNDYRWSPHLPALARALKTSVEYLTGDNDDPDANAPAPVLQDPPVHHVLLAVALPTERALAQMFEAFLEIVEAFPDRPDTEETARLFAQWLPIGLSQLRDLLPDAPPAAVAPEIRRELAEALATDDRGPRR